MNYPQTITLKVEQIFGAQDISITLHSGLTTFVGTNASGKTQTLKALRNKFKHTLGPNKVRYLSSNRIGNMEEYRSKVDQYGRSADDYTLGNLETKKSGNKSKQRMVTFLQWMQEKMCTLKLPNVFQFCLIAKYSSDGMQAK